MDDSNNKNESFNEESMEDEELEEQDDLEEQEQDEMPYQEPINNNYQSNGYNPNLRFNQNNNIYNNKKPLFNRNKNINNKGDFGNQYNNNELNDSNKSDNSNNSNNTNDDNKINNTNNNNNNRFNNNSNKNVDSRLNNNNSNRNLSNINNNPKNNNGAINTNVNKSLNGGSLNALGSKTKESSTSKSLGGETTKNVSGANKMDEVSKMINAAKKAEEEGKSKTVAVAKEKAKAEIKKRVMTFIIANLPMILLVIGIILIVLIILLAIFTLIFGAIDGSEENGSSSDVPYTCSSISMTSTTLSKDDFINAVNASSTKEIFKSNAGKIYDIAKNNNANPELIVVRAKLEGYSPGVGNNYWGLGCFNGKKDCFSYTSFDQGVFEYIKNISRYQTLEQMLSNYAYIGDYWYNTSEKNTENTGLGGCYYFPYIRQFMSEARAATVEYACRPGNWCYKSGGGSCVRTNDEDQMAYAKWQVQRMVDERKNIFNIDADECEDEGSDVEIPDDGTLGSQVATYAVETFDSYSYSQDLRFSANYVDCSSLVYRAYAHFGYKFGGNTTASTEYVWCKNNGKEVSSSELKAGDLIFYNQGSYYASDRPYNIGHVTIYLGNNKQFSARSARYAQEDQVAVTPYVGKGSYFCRPYK